MDTQKDVEALVTDLIELPDKIATVRARLLDKTACVELLKEQIKTEQALALSAAEGSNAQKRQTAADLMLEDNKGYQGMRRELLFMREKADEAVVEYERLRNRFSAAKSIAAMIAGKANG